MRILQITRNFPPLRGGMERLNERLFDSLYRQDPACALIGPPGSRLHAPPGARVRELPPGSLPRTLVASVWQGVALARALRPDLVLGGSGLAAPAVVAAARMAGAVPAIYLHGLDIIVPNATYQRVWLPCIRRCRRVLVNSANTGRIAMEAGIDPRLISVVHPGTDLPAPDPGARARFRHRHGIDDAVPVLLSVGRLTARKGIAEFVEHSLPQVLSRHPRAQLVIIGDEAAHALHRVSGGGFDRVRQAAARSGGAAAVRWLGPCSEDELADAYEGADVHVFPVREMAGDVEGFGMVAIEAAARGLPTAAFAVGGVPDAIADGTSGRLAAAGDYAAMTAAIDELLDAARMPGRQGLARGFARGFSWERFGWDVLHALEGAA